MQQQNDMVKCKLLFEMAVFTKVLLETEQQEEEGYIVHQGIPARNTFLQTLSFETGTARNDNDCVVPGTLTDSYCQVILLNKGLNLLLLFPKGN